MSSSIFIGKLKMFHLMKFHRLAFFNIQVIFQCYRALGVQLTFWQLGPALLSSLSLGPRNILTISNVYQGKLVSVGFSHLQLSHQGLSLGLSCWAWSQPRSEDLWSWNTPTLFSNLSHPDPEGLRDKVSQDILLRTDHLSLGPPLRPGGLERNHCGIL